MKSIPFISLEGTDLSGKSTLYKELWKEIQKANNFEALVTDRGYFSVLCYGVLYNRAPKEVLEANFLNWLNKNVVLYLSISNETIIERYKIRSDEDRTLEEILRVKSIYDEYATKYIDHPNFFQFSYPMLGSEWCKGVIDGIKARNLFFWPNKASVLVDKFGNPAHGTKELIDFSFEVSDTWIRLNQYHLLRQGLEIRDKWAQLEIDSYNYQESRFARSVETVLCGYKGKAEGIDSRKFVFTDDECMSYLHILVRGSDFYVKVQFRSSDVKMLEHDVKEIARMVISFSNKIKFSPKNVHFSIHIDSLHKYEDKHD